MTFTSSDIIIIKSLLQSENVNIHSLHVEYQLSPAQLQLSINKFVAVGILDVDGVNIRLTKSGVDWIYTHRKSLFLDVNRRFWKTRSDDTHNSDCALGSIEYFIAINDILEESEEGN